MAEISGLVIFTNQPDMNIPKSHSARFPSGLSRCQRCGRPPRGMTLLELTVVILVLLSLVTTLFFGAQAWKRGSDRALCIIHIQNVQKSVRSYANLYGYDEGDSAPGLQGQIIGLGKYIEATPICPAGGNYSFGAVHGADTIPPMGSLYMECTLSGTFEHVPANYGDW
jgi:prepilin-type N-terminal cleavage/methylation domain-containing protein